MNRLKLFSICEFLCHKNLLFEMNRKLLVHNPNSKLICISPQIFEGKTVFQFDLSLDSRNIDSLSAIRNKCYSNYSFVFIFMLLNFDLKMSELC